MITNAGRIRSVYEFMLKAVPGEIVRLRVIETSEGTYYGLPDHVIDCDDDESVKPCTQVPPTTTPEKALQDTLQALLSQICRRIPAACEIAKW